MSLKETAYVLPWSSTARLLVQETIHSIMQVCPPPEPGFADPLFVLNEWIQFHHSFSVHATPEQLCLNVWDFTYRRYEGALCSVDGSDDNDPAWTLAEFMQAVTQTVYPQLHMEVTSIARYLYHLNTEIEIIEHPSTQFIVAVGFPQCN